MGSHRKGKGKGEERKENRKQSEKEVVAKRRGGGEEGRTHGPGPRWEKEEITRKKAFGLRKGFVVFVILQLHLLQQSTPLA